MVNKLCGHISNYFLSGSKADERNLFNKVFDLSRYFIQNSATLESLEKLFALEQKIMTSKGPHRQFIEKQILEILSRISMSLTAKNTHNSYLDLKEELLEKIDNINERQRYLVALKLANFAIEVFNFKQTRDSFSNKRKSLALEILSNISSYYNLPEAHDLCLLSLKSKKKALILAALEFQERYIRDRKTSLGSDIIEILDDIIEHTKDHSVAVSALDIQVKTDNISEFEALSRIDEWKEKHDYW